MSSSERSFGGLSAGQKVGLIVGWVILGVWLGVAGIALLATTALGAGGCGGSDTCADRIVTAILASLGLLVVAFLAATFSTFARGGLGRRVGVLIAAAIVAPPAALGLALAIGTSGY